MKQNKQKNSEEGFILILFPFVFISLLTALALVIDSANIYAAKLKTASASEAAVTSAVASFITERDPVIRASFGATTVPGQSTANENDYLKNRSDQALEANLLSTGFTMSQDANYSKNISFNLAGIRSEVVNMPQGNVLTATATVNVPTLLMHIVPNISGDSNTTTRKTTVSGSASSPIVGANFIILLDLSSSQSCPTFADGTGGYCDCNSPNRTENGVTLTCQQEANNATPVQGVPPNILTSIRVQTIRESLLQVIPLLDNGRDRLSIIGFNNSAFVLLPFRANNGPGNISLQGFDRQEAINAINRLRTRDEVPAYLASGATLPPIVPEGSTNISDAMITAFEEAREGGLVTNNLKFNVIYYSDGAATAMRGTIDGLAPTTSLNSPRDISTAVNNYTNRFSDSDYINYQVTLGDPSKPNNFITTPGPFVKTSEYKRDYKDNVRNSVQGGNILPQVQYTPKSMNVRGYSEDALAPCHRPSGIIDKRIFSVSKQERVQGINACFSSNIIKGKFSFSKDNNEVSSSFGGNIVDDNFITDISGQFRYLYYVAALNAADFLRSNGARIYAVGFGPPSNDFSDPAQNLDDASKQKSAIMGNISNHFTRLEQYPNLKEFDTLNNYKGDYKKAKDRKTEGKQGEGVYYESPSGADLTNMIASIIQLAKLRISGVG